MESQKDLFNSELILQRIFPFFFPCMIVSLATLFSAYGATGQ